MSLRAPVPPYFDHLIAGFRAGQAGRNVHLGYWDNPPPLDAPCSSGEFEAAQAKLTDVLIAMADIRDGQRVLDVGCGFGGVLEALGKGHNVSRVGVNIDPRQLDICRSLPIGDNPLTLIEADACSLPFESETFDRVFCVEAMFHFQSREAFLAQAARVLKSGGRLITSDILLREPGAEAPMSGATIETIIRHEFGPWPHPWVEADEIVAAAARQGLALTETHDATRQTLPSYRITAPQRDSGFPNRLSAGHLLRWLHASGFATYCCQVFTRA